MNWEGILSMAIPLLVVISFAQNTRVEIKDVQPVQRSPGPPIVSWLRTNRHESIVSRRQGCPTPCDSKGGSR